MVADEAMKDGVPTFYARTRDEWRGWLEENGETQRSVWAIIYRKRSATPSVRFHDAIVDALCFGWVDSKAAPRDDESCYLLFSPRNPKSTWGRVNRQRAEEMIRQGLMRPPGQAMIDLAKRTGTWDSLAEAQNGVVPDDLQQRFDSNEAAATNFAAFPPSSRIDQTVELAAQNIRANHPR